MQNNTFPVFPDNGIIRFVMLPEMSKKSFVLLGSTSSLWFYLRITEALRKHVCEKNHKSRQVPNLDKKSSTYPTQLINKR